MLSFIMTSPGTTGTDEPPGITALILRPPFIPPAYASSSLKGTPMGSSKLPPFSTCPEIEKITVPPEFTGPSEANQAGPLRKIVGTEAKL